MSTQPGATGVSKTGVVRQCLAGFYTVEADDGCYVCRARGVFRQQGVTPVAGDRVHLCTVAPGEGYVEAVLPRRNLLIRPPVANVDVLAVVVSMAQPRPHPVVVDKLVALAEKNHIEPMVVLNKCELDDPAAWKKAYTLAGIAVHVVSARTGEGLDRLRNDLKGRLVVLTGNSGVGKSSLLSALYPQWKLDTGEISHKLGRGRHTTRAVTLYPLPGEGYIADTPGFSSVDIERAQRLYAEELPDCFREFAPYLGRCKYTSCTHVCEAGCAVRAAVEQGSIARQRYDSYVAMYREVKDNKKWQE